MKILISDQKIIEALGGADESKTNEAFRYLYRSYFPMALKFVLQNNGNEAEAADVFQDVLIGFYQNIRKNRFRGDSTLKTYLYSMVRNLWLVKLKRNQKTVNMDMGTEMKTLTSQSSTTSKEALNQMVEKLLEEIGEKCRALLKRYYFDNYSMSDIADSEGYENENSAKTQKYKCMKKLISLIEEKPHLKETIYDLLAEK